VVDIDEREMKNDVDPTMSWLSAKMILDSRGWPLIYYSLECLQSC